MKINLNGAEFEFDIYEAETADKFERGLTDIQKKCAEAERTQNAADSIVAQCNIVFAFIDSLFGEGASNKIFGKSVSFAKCMDVLDEIIDSADKQTKAMAERKNKYAQLRGKV